MKHKPQPGTLNHAILDTIKYQHDPTIIPTRTHHGLAVYERPTPTPPNPDVLRTTLANLLAVLEADPDIQDNPSAILFAAMNMARTVLS